MKNLTIPRLFGPAPNRSYPPAAIMDEFEETCRELFHKKYEEFEYATGASKIVITSFSESVVYKFPYRGYFEYDKIYTDKIPVEDMGFRDLSIDYCDFEVDLEEQIPEEFQKFFAWIDRIEERGIVYYRQEKCTVDDWSDDITFKTTAASDSLNSENRWFSEKWLARAEELYGEEEVLEFLEWLADFGISDLHGENYGYTNDGELPVIIDWGGYEG